LLLWFAWKVLNFGSGNTDKAVTVTLNFAVGAVHIVEGQVETANVWTPAQYTDTWEVQPDGEDSMKITRTGAGAGARHVRVRNAAKQGPLSLGFGFDRNGDYAEYIMVQADVPLNQASTFEFKPSLKFYLTSQYQEGHMIRADIGSDKLYELKLADIQDGKVYNLTLKEQQDSSYTLSDGLPSQQEKRLAVFTADHEWQFFSADV